MNKGIAVFVYLILIVGLSCTRKKLEEKAFEPSTMNKFFEEYVLNKDITVNSAKFEGRDTTPMYNGYVFKLIKNSYYDGPFEARYNGNTYMGTWQCNDDYSKLSLNITQTGALQWVSIHWKFKSKSFTTMELIPWFNTDGDRYVKFVQ